MSKLCIVVPTYNEAENIPKLIMEIEKVLWTRDFMLVVVDDNSPDKTAQIADKLHKVYGNIVVLRRSKKFGLGSALTEGLRFALAMDDVERIVTLDGDLSHSPNEIPRLLCAAEKADLVQGSRYVESGNINGWVLSRRLLSRVANLVCRLFFRTFIHEHTGNFRVYSRKCAEAVVKYTSCKGFEWVVEAMFVARKYGFTVKEVPISFSDRHNGKTKLKALDVASWAIFVARNVFSQFTSVVRFVKR